MPGVPCADIFFHPLPDKLLRKPGPLKPHLLAADQRKRVCPCDCTSHAVQLALIYHSKSRVMSENPSFIFSLFWVTS